jgi:hypothetical protein
MKYIIARFNEDISWSDGLDRFVVQKGEHVPNTGREASSWLWYIVQHYDELEGTYAFRQGTPDGPYHGLMWGSGNAAWEKLTYDHDLQPLADHLEIELPELLLYSLGAQYDVPAEVIFLRPKEWYEKALLAADTWDRAAYLFERLWPHIWNNQATPWTPNS